jgi:hypothetical protein
LAGDYSLIGVGVGIGTLLRPLGFAGQVGIEYEYEFEYEYEESAIRITSTTQGSPISIFKFRIAPPNFAGQTESAERHKTELDRRAAGAVECFA